MHNIVEKASPFTQQSKDQLSNAISRTTNLYAKCVTRGDHSAALRQLRVHQREHVRELFRLVLFLLMLTYRLCGNEIPFGVK
jgi:hypothetical protein